MLVGNKIAAAAPEYVTGSVETGGAAMVVGAAPVTPLLLEHDAVVEAAVVPSPDPVRLAVVKAYVVLAAGYEPTAETAASVLGYAREHLAPYKRIRRIEFAELPKTISGKIRRVELRAGEQERHPDGAGERTSLEFWEDDLT